MPDSVRLHKAASEVDVLDLLTTTRDEEAFDGHLTYIRQGDQRSTTLAVHGTRDNFHVARWPWALGEPIDPRMIDDALAAKKASLTTLERILFHGNPAIHAVITGGIWHRSKTESGMTRRTMIEQF